MRENTASRIGSEELVQQHEAELDLVVPVTTPELTRAAVAAADKMGAGLNAKVRLVKVQVVPHQMDLADSPVYIDFLKKQLEQFQSELPACGEIRLARDFEAGLKGTLRSGSLVILGMKKRLWRTRNERLAASLRHAGHRVLLVEQEKHKEAEHA